MMRIEWSLGSRNVRVGESLGNGFVKRALPDILPLYDREVPRRLAEADAT
jgi:hypothetical protein